MVSDKKVIMIKYIILIMILIVAGIAWYTFFFYMPAIETFKPEFPKEFDTLIVDHYEEKWVINRNKKVDKFINKSKRISEHVGEGPDMYRLKFIKDGKEIFSITYDEYGYPKDAVRIMKELLEENEKIQNDVDK